MIYLSVKINGLLVLTLFLLEMQHRGRMVHSVF